MPKRLFIQPGIKNPRPLHGKQPKKLWKKPSICLCIKT